LELAPLHAYANVIFQIHISCLERLMPQWLCFCKLAVVALFLLNSHDGSLYRIGNSHWGLRLACLCQCYLHIHISCLKILKPLWLYSCELAMVALFLLNSPSSYNLFRSRGGSMSVYWPEALCLLNSRGASITVK
jgi:hypothetical protein